MLKNKKLQLIILSIILAIIFFGLGVFFEKSLPVVGKESDIKELRESSFNQNKYNYKYINPLLACEVSSQKDVEEFKPLKEKINNFINDEIKNKDVDSVSVDFDVRDGRWFGINPDEEYYPASLLKVPLMIAVLKVAEAEPNLLSKKNYYKGDLDLTKEQNFKPEVTLEPGHYYATEDLLRRMISYSDNNVLPLLLGNISSGTLSGVYSDLGISLDDPRMNVKEYASFFRVLYNATYLNRDMSEKALNFLAHSDFSQGIVAGVSKNTTVVQKFGERNAVDQNGQSILKELHDCGIIYYPKHPYLLCVMTKGQDFNKLSKVIQNISAIVFKNLDSEFNNK